MNDFQVVSNESELSELDTSLALRCQFERLTGVGRIHSGLSLLMMEIVQFECSGWCPRHYSKLSFRAQ